jgi:sec-independent protein translocase protein TatC
MARPAKSATRDPTLPAKLPVKLPRLPRLPDPETPDVIEEMTLLEHMEELRDRIVKAAIAIGVAFIAGIALAIPLLDLIVKQAGVPPDVRDPLEPLTIFFKIALYIAIGIATPVIMWQFIGFLAPGLTNKEKRILFSALPFVGLLFVAGASYAFLVAIPRALAFLSTFLEGRLTWNPDAPEIVNFYLTMMVGLGLAFQLPVVMFLLAKFDILTTRQMRENRKYALLLILGVSVVITPTTDPISLAFVAAPLYVLYELGILLGRVLARWRPGAESRITSDRHLALIVLPMYLLYRAGLWLGGFFGRPPATAFAHSAIARRIDG